MIAKNWDPLEENLPSWMIRETKPVPGINPTSDFVEDELWSERQTRLAREREVHQLEKEQLERELKQAHAEIQRLRALLNELGQNPDLKTLAV